jgi:hypothetical protein
MTLPQEAARLATFERWPHSYILVSDFVRTGLVFEPTLTNPDQCRCCSCHAVFAEWKHGDNPVHIHAAASPLCPFTLSCSVRSDHKPAAAALPLCATDAADDAASVSGTASTAATPVTKRKARQLTNLHGNSKGRLQKRMQNMSALSAASADLFSQFPLTQLPVTDDFSMLPFLMHAHQFSALLQAQAGYDQQQQQPMQPILFDPSIHLPFDPTQAIASLISSSCVQPESLQTPAPYWLNATLPSFNMNPLHMMPAPLQNN